MNKNDAQDVNPKMSNIMEKINIINNDSIAWTANIHLSGSYKAIVQCDTSIGSSYGSKRVALSGFYAQYLAIVHSSSRASKIIGLIKYLKRKLIIQKSDMEYTMPLISTRMYV